MLNDDFWFDPDLMDLTRDQMYFLSLFLQWNKSGVIGIYRIMWSSVSAGSRSPVEEILCTLKGLQAKGLIEFEEISGWIWVKEWWKHNSLKGAFTGKVQKKAYEELGCVPAVWRNDVIQWLKNYDPDGVLQGLETTLEGRRMVDGSTIEEAAGNPNPIPTSISTTTNPGSSGIKIIEDLEDLIEAAVWTHLKTKPLLHEAAFREAVRKRIVTSGANSSDKLSLEKWRAEISARDAREQIHLQKQQVQAEQQAKEAAAHAVAHAHFESLNEDAKQSVIREFGVFLEQSNPQVFNFYKKNGLESKLVRTDFTKFLAANMSASQGTKHEL